MSVSAAGRVLGSRTITMKNLSFDFLLPVPQGLGGRREVAAEIEVSRTYKEPEGGRELGLLFGRIGWEQR